LLPNVSLTKRLSGIENNRKDCKSASARIPFNRARIQAQPEIYAELRPGIRRGLLRRFPFSVIYEITGDAILVLAVAHQHRKPFYGRDA